MSTVCRMDVNLLSHVIKTDRPHIDCCVAVVSNEINGDGRLVCNGKLTAWDSSNLIDTGRNVGVEN